MYILSLDEKLISQTAQSGISIWYQKCNKNPVFMTQQVHENILHQLDFNIYFCWWMKCLHLDDLSSNSGFCVLLGLKMELLDAVSILEKGFLIYMIHVYKESGNSPHTFIDYTKYRVWHHGYSGGNYIEPMKLYFY